MKKNNRTKKEGVEWLSDQRGQAVLEFALIMPLLLFLLFAIFTVGYWMNAQQIVTQAAAQGARQGALTNDNGQIQGAIADNMKAIDPDIDKNPPQPRTSILIKPTAQGDPGRKRGNKLTITVMYEMPFFFESLSEKFKTVNATIISQIECDPEPGKDVCPP
ncbi:MAG: pilus assembly protein [Candidatus Uhrbacteria bacterium]|nr:pilus assembly protein [Candidatus Uhrbacteria bacterium]